MGVKEQLVKIKDNWLLVLVVLLVFGFFSFGGSTSSLMSKGVAQFGGAMDYAMAESASFRGGGVYMPSYGSDFAPDVEERKITKTASLSSEIERGEFSDSDSRLRAIVTSSDSFLLNENVNQNGEKKRAYMRGYYQIKVDVSKYDAVVSQLKELGEVQSFSENSQDITGTYVSIADQLEVEMDKLQRYQEMYTVAEEVSDQIDLVDRIASQERTIKYLEDRLATLDTRVGYSTITVTLTEEQSGYANVVFVKFSELIQNFVSSINGLLNLVFVLIPWAIAVFIIWMIVKVFKRKA